MTSAEYCETRTRGSGSSFFYAFLFLPEAKRRAMMALYAFCREVDDIADEIKDRDVAIGKLGFWSSEIANVFAGKAQHPVGKELQWARQHYRLDEELFVEIIDGMLMDINRQPILKRADLSLYCYRVAGVVGLLSIEIFGYTERKSRDFATHLGEALQLTNILRDVAQDAGNGRIYLPQEERIRFNVRDQDFHDGPTDAMKLLMKHYAEQAEAAYAKAVESLPDKDRASLRPSLLMASIYYAQLAKLRRIDFDVWNDSAHISPLRKIWIAWRAWRYEKKAVAKGLPVRLEF